MESFEYSKAFDLIWERIQGLNRRIDDEKPWSLAKAGETEKLKHCMNEMIAELLFISRLLEPFLPRTSKRIREVFIGEIEPPKTPLFPKN
jgi:methionyl-tRNA synthetase